MSFDRPGPRVRRFLIVAMATALAGCGLGETGDVADHGPHGGHVMATSGDVDFRLELAPDGVRRRMTLYVQARETGKPWSLDVVSLEATFMADGQTFEALFNAAPRPTDPAEAASRYAIGFDDLPQQLLAADRFVLNVTIPTPAEGATFTLRHDSNHGHTYRHD